MVGAAEEALRYGRGFVETLQNPAHLLSGNQSGGGLGEKGGKGGEWVGWGIALLRCGV